MMQGYAMEVAVPLLCTAVAKSGVKAPRGEVEAFVRRAIAADMAYMHQTGVLTEDGLMGEGEYDEDDAFEALFDALTDGLTDDAQIGRVAQMLDAYMEAQQDFLARSGLTD